VAADANDSAMKAHHAELQSALERVRDFAEAHVGQWGLRNSGARAREAVAGDAASGDAWL